MTKNDKGQSAIDALSLSQTRKRVIECNRCRKKFMSKDPKRNRRCVSCEGQVRMMSRGMGRMAVDTPVQFDVSRVGQIIAK